MSTTILHTLYILRESLVQEPASYVTQATHSPPTCNAPTKQRPTYVIKRMLLQTLLTGQQMDPFWGFVTTKYTRVQNTALLTRFPYTLTQQNSYICK
jgi:hypothetical protein